VYLVIINLMIKNLWYY